MTDLGICQYECSVHRDSPWQQYPVLDGAAPVGVGGGGQFQLYSPHDIYYPIQINEAAGIYRMSQTPKLNN